MRSKSKIKHVTIHSVLALSLLAVAVPENTYADGVSITSADSLFEIPTIGSVWINNSSYFELKNVRLTSGADNNVVTFTVKAVNGGSSDIQFIDYWIRLQSSTGAKFTVNVLPQDKDKNIIPSGGTQEIQFFANVTPSLKLSDMEFKVIKWDFSATDYQRELGTLIAPVTYSTIAPAGSKANIRIAKTSFKGHIKKATISSNEENYMPSMLFELENTDARSLKLPALKFMIRTTDGLLYPLQANGINESTTIDPLMKKEVALSGKLPRSISNEGWQLVITESADANLNVAIAEFEIPKAIDAPVSTEKEQSFSNKDGTYLARFESLQRVPWEDNDVISATVNLVSKENKSLPIPSITGYLMLDDSVKVEVKVIQTDNVIGLQPGKEVRLQLLGTIPYTYDFSSVTVHLQEKEGANGNTGSTSNGGTGGTVNDLVQFKINTELDNIPLINAREPYKLGGIGRSGNYLVHSIHKFAGKSSDIVTAQIEVENLEKRSNELSKLVAHFKGSDGTIYPAAITDIKTKISPSGKAVLFVWANIASNKSQEITQLILGEAITDGKYTIGEGKPDSYVNAISFLLPSEETIPENNVTGIDLFPYKLNLSRIGTAIDNSKVSLKFDYELEKDLQYVVNPEDYKIIVELEDASGKGIMEWQLNVEKAKEGALEGKDDLKLGKEKIELTKDDKDFIYQVTFLKKYKLRIYSVFQGEKKLLASKEFEWFLTSD